MKVGDIFKRQVTVARIFGIPVRFDYRWFIVFVLSVWLIAMNLSRGGMWVGSFKLLPVSVTVAWLLAIVGTLIILKIVDATIGLRVTKEEEIQGLDNSMHNEEGYIFES